MGKKIPTEKQQRAPQLKHKVKEVVLVEKKEEPRVVLKPIGCHALWVTCLPADILSSRVLPPTAAAVLLLQPQRY